MTSSLAALLGAAASVALVHTLIGVDHFLPFVVLGKARRWSLAKTLSVSGICGLVHVLSSVLLGAVGIGLGLTIERLKWIEAFRGELAAWLLIAFGLVYAAWGLHRAAHEHHSHEGTRQNAAYPASVTPTIGTLMALFLLGPCEPLIPLLMAPAFQHDWLATVAVGITFCTVTLAAMLGMVAAGFLGVRRLPTVGLENHAHTLAGLAIALSGAGVKLLGI